MKLSRQWQRGTGRFIIRENSVGDRYQNQHQTVWDEEYEIDIPDETYTPWIELIGSLVMIVEEIMEDIPGETGPTYETEEGDEDRTISCRVMATNDAP